VQRCWELNPSNPGLNQPPANNRQFVHRVPCLPCCEVAAAAQLRQWMLSHYILIELCTLHQHASGIACSSLHQHTPAAAHFCFFGHFRRSSLTTCSIHMIAAFTLLLRTAFCTPPRRYRELQADDRCKAQQWGHLSGLPSLVKLPRAKLPCSPVSCMMLLVVVMAWAAVRLQQTPLWAPSS
jgi:hypothetical protein